MATRSREFWRDYGLLIGGSAVLWAIVLVGGWAGYRYVWGRYGQLWSLLTGGLVERPRELADPGVVHGAGALVKRRFLQEKGLGEVTAISARPRPPGRGTVLTIVGSRGAVIADSLGRVERRVAFGAPGFGKCLDRMEAILGRDGDPVGFLSRGSWACPTAWLDPQGRVLWRYGGSQGVDDTAVGDLDGDGRLDFVVGFNGGGGVHRVDASGRKVWSEPDGNVWRLALLDTDRDGRLEIIHSNAEGRLTIRDPAGRVVRRVNPPIYLSHFSLVRWPGADVPALLQMEDERIVVLDIAGATVASLPAPRARTTLDAVGTPVRARADQAEFFAVVGTYSPWKRSVLYVHAPSGALLYEEILPDVCAGVAALPALDGGPESLLLGCDGLVWRYDLS
jgi:FG-GAP-like repeat